MEPIIPLPIDLSNHGSRSLARTLQQELRRAILDGRFHVGLRLPSTRALAAHFGVSRNTVLAAYDRLVAEGYIKPRQGSGTVVAHAAPLRDPSMTNSLRVKEHRLNRQWRGSRSPRDEVGRDVRKIPRIAFHLGVPDLMRVPRLTWHRLSGRVARRPPIDASSMFDPQGIPVLREAIARHVSFTRAVACGPDDIVVTAGAQQAFDLLARVLLTSNRSQVALENPGYSPCRQAFQAHGARIAPVSVDEEGMVLERIPSSARLVCVTPSHQFPLGTVMSLHRRMALLDWCRPRSAVVIEDDYDGEFRYEDRPLDALQSLDRDQLVFYVGTFSKCLSPDLRLGYIVAPSWAKAALVAARRIADGHSSIAAQATLALMIREGHLARHIRRMQRLYARRRELLLGGLRSDFHRWIAPLPSVAGLHIGAVLQFPCNESALVLRAAAAGVGISGLRPHYVGRPQRRGLLFGFGNIEEGKIIEGLDILRQLF